MALAAFDTLKFTKRLKSVGVPFEQAEAEAEVLAEIFEINLKNLAIKEDLLATKTDLQREIDDLRRDMDAQFAGMDAKRELLRKDMELQSARFERLLIRVAVILAVISLAGPNLGVLARLFH